MKIIVAGSKDIVDKNLVFNVINKSNFEITEIVSGGYKGVDSFAEEWAVSKGIRITKFVPHYPIKETEFSTIAKSIDMTKYADGLIAVWNGKSKGTEYVIECMKRLDKPTEIYKI